MGLILFLFITSITTYLTSWHVSVVLCFVHILGAYIGYKNARVEFIGNNRTHCEMCDKYFIGKAKIECEFRKDCPHSMSTAIGVATYYKNRYEELKKSTPNPGYPAGAPAMRPRRRIRIAPSKKP